MTTGQLYLFGRFEAVVHGRKISHLKSRKVEELLSHLLLSRSRGVHREQLADQLWPDVDLQRSRKYLRQALWQLQRVADSAILPGSDQLLTVDQEWIGINPEADLWVDVFEFERAYESSIDSHSPRLTDAQRLTLRDAVNLYRGELLAGWYSDWCLSHQQFYRSIYLAMLEKLMRDSEAVGDWEEGLFYGSKLLREDRANEPAHVAMMRLYCMAGNRTAALRQFDMCAEALREEVDVEPDVTARGLHERIRDYGCTVQPPADGLAQQVDRAEVPVSGYRALRDLEFLRPASYQSGYLRSLQGFLSRMQAEVAGHIEELDSSVHLDTARRGGSGIELHGQAS